MSQRSNHLSTDRGGRCRGEIIFLNSEPRQNQVEKKVPRSSTALLNVIQARNQLDILCKGYHGESALVITLSVRPLWNIVDATHQSINMSLESYYEKCNEAVKGLLAQIAKPRNQDLVVRFLCGLNECSSTYHLANNHPPTSIVDPLLQEGMVLKKNTIFRTQSQRWMMKEK